MILSSPAEALGSYASMVREIAVDVARRRHGYAAEAHEAAHTRNTRGYSTLWQDLLIDAQEAFRDRGHELHTLAPAGHRVPIVNGCLVYVWRVPASGDPAHFAQSPTKLSSFNAPLPDPTLFDADFIDSDGSVESEAVVSDPERAARPESVIEAVGGVMPLVLVLVHSSPRQLQAIDWAVAELDPSSGEVILHGSDTIWQPEIVGESDDFEGESFDGGTPVEVALAPLEQEDGGPDAR